MQCGIEFERSPFSDDETELHITVGDGTAKFAVDMYASRQQLEQQYAGLSALLDRTSGIYDAQFGRFGPEFAGGAAHFRFHLRQGLLFVTAQLQARHIEFGQFAVAPESKLYLRSDAESLGSFVHDFRELIDSKTELVTFALFG